MQTFPFRITGYRATLYAYWDNELFDPKNVNNLMRTFLIVLKKKLEMARKCHSDGEYVINSTDECVQLGWKFYTKNEIYAICRCRKIRSTRVAPHSDGFVFDRLSTFDACALSGVLHYLARSPRVDTSVFVYRKVRDLRLDDEEVKDVLWRCIRNTIQAKCRLARSATLVNPYVLEAHMLTVHCLSIDYRSAQDPIQ